MSSFEQRDTGVRFGPHITRAVKALLIANGAVFGVQVLLHIASPGPFGAFDKFTELFALRPSLAIGGLHVWQFISHSFLHDVGNPFHIFFNMFLLWMFGSDVEGWLGPRRFLKLYFAAALAGGIGMIPWYDVSIVGASGAVFGVMAMYARLFPTRRVYVWGIFPVRARTLVFVLVALDLLFAIRGSDTGTAHFAHVGGFIAGWFFLPLEHAAAGLRGKWNASKAARSEREEQAVRAKVDELLAKVAREGLGSLTDREREFLKRSSRRFRR